jgi:hypothetical protein
MTDDFQLFQDQAGHDPVDADIALITAYLARELSPVQIVAVEERLANDSAFRMKCNPILEAWVMPTALSAVPAGQGPLSRDEVEAGWKRYVGEHAELDAHGGPRLVVEGTQRKRRKISMTRIAAGIAAITLPVLALAQVVVYASKHPSVPGHSAAKNIVAPFVAAPPPIAPEPQEKTPPNPVDVPVGRQLEKGQPAVQRAAPAEVPAAETLRPAATAPSNPDREKIIALAKKYMPAVVSGDTNVNYAVIVLDAADNYVWSTYGTGAVQILIGGDSRSGAERADFTLKHMSDYMGFAPGARGGGGSIGGSLYVIRDSLGNALGTGGRARGGGGSGTTRIVTADSLVARLGTRRDSIGQVILRVDSAVAGLRVGGASGRVGGGGRVGGLNPLVGGARVGGGARGSSGVAGGVSGRGGGAGFSIRADSGSYAVGLGARARDGQVILNSAAGLQDPGNGESGIQGLKTKSLTMGETYRFAAGQLSPNALSIVVIHLAPGTNWAGR